MEQNLFRSFVQTRIHQEHCITTAQFVWKCFENWEFHLYKCIHTPVFEVRCVLRQREINWGRRLGNDAITAGYEEHMRRSLADEGRDSLQLRPITNCSSSVEPDEYLHFWKKKKNKCKTYFLSFFGVSTKIEGNWFQIARRWDSWVWLCPGEGIYKSR